MKTGRRTVLAGMFGAVVAGVLPALPARSAGGFVLQSVSTPVYRLDFGGIGGTAPPPYPGYVKVRTQLYSATTGWGWVASVAGLNARDRGAVGDPVTLERDFIFGTTTPRTFRLGKLTPGRYRVTLISGDLSFGDHWTRVQVAGAVVDGGSDLPVLHPSIAQFATLTFTAVVPVGSSAIDLTLSAPLGSYVINALELDAVADAEPAEVTFSDWAIPSTWGPILTSPDPTAALLAGHRGRVTNSPWPTAFEPTGLTRSAYLSLIAGEVDFWKTKQDATGAIIDPYLNREFQYSTPSFAHAAAALVAYAGRADLLEAAALALDWSARTLSTRTAASGHEDFFAPMIAHSIRLLKPHVPAERSAAWEADIASFEPVLVYRFGTGVNNWNVVAASGEALFQIMGIREATHRYAEASFAGQGRHFGSLYGLYLEGPMAYDHFPRLWVGDLIGRGYSGAYAQELTETLRRGAITSMFMQSPVGELPAGGRSAHHQWNEAQQCVTFEVFAARALADGDTSLAAFYKRAARLSFRSMRRWVRPSGEMQIVKNWVDPSQNHGYETYSAHSQYNLLAMSMLAIAYEHAETTDAVAELPAPADTGGFVLDIPELHKVFANAGGAYVEVETRGDHDYDATGLIRVHFSGHSPQLGTSDSVLAAPKYLPTTGTLSPATTGVGVAWQAEGGAWQYLGALTSSQVQSVTVTPGAATGDNVAFTVRYAGNLGGGVTAVEEQFVLTPKDIQVTTLLSGYTGPVRRVVPVLSHDGRTDCKVQINGDEAMFWQQGEFGTSKQTFQAIDATKVTIGKEDYPNHNGWVNLAVAEYPAGAGANGVTLNISTQGSRPLYE